MIKAAMDLGCLDLGCISASDKKNSVGEANPLEFSNSASKSGRNQSPREMSALRKSQSKKSSQRKTSPLGWFPRKKVDSYLNRKIKKLQEVGGMNQTLDETLGDSNPHYCKIVREQMAVRETASRAMELRKAALVEASWCRILRAARIPSSEAETLMENAEKAAVVAFEAASAMGVIMHDKPNSSRKQYQIETSETHGEGSPTHTVTASFETAFDVDKEVAAAVKDAFARLSNSSFLSKDEFKDLLRKISENPDLRDNNEMSEMSSECETESDSEFGTQHKDVQEVANTSDLKMRQLKVKRRQSFGKFNREKLVDMMLERLHGLQEDQLSSLASIVATCGLNKALAEIGNQKLQTTNIEPTGSRRESFMEGKALRNRNESEIPSLDKFLVKHMTKLEKEVYEAKRTSKDDPKGPQGPETVEVKRDKGVVRDTVPDLGSILVKHSSKLEKEIEKAKKNSGVNVRKKSNRNKPPLDPTPDLGSLLVKKHVSRLQKEVEETIRNHGEMYENVKKPGNKDSVPEVPSLDSCLVKHVSKLEKEVQEAKKKNKEDHEARDFKQQKENVDLNNRAETQEESLDKILVKPIHRLEREKTQAARSYLQRKQAVENELGYESLDKILVKHVPKLEKEKMMIKAEEDLEEETRPILTRRQVRDKELLEAWGGLGLGDQTMAPKHKKKPEIEKKETTSPLLNRREAREKEMQEAWGGLDLGNSIRPSLSKLEREKAAWIKAEEDEKIHGN